MAVIKCKYPPSPRSVQIRYDQETAKPQLQPLPQPLPQPHPQALPLVLPGRCSRGVTIDESANVEFDNRQWCQEDTVKGWYTSEEMRQFKADYRDLCRQISKRETAMLSRCPASWGNAVLRWHQACCGDSDNVILPTTAVDHAVILQRMHTSHGRVGMEWHLIPNRKSSRRWNRRQVLVAARSGATDSCAALSHPAVQFAHGLALVLQQCVREAQSL